MVVRGRSPSTSHTAQSQTKPVQSIKTFSARVNETFRGLHPKAILGINKRLTVSQQCIRTTPVFVSYLQKRKMKLSCIIAHYIVNDLFQRRNWFNLLTFLRIKIK